MVDCMFRLLLALLVLVQPMLLGECAALAATPEPCAPHCGDMDHPRTPQTAPCCKLAPAKSDPQALKTATVELRANDVQPMQVAARTVVVLPQVQPLRRAEASPTDLLHKRPLSEVLCVLLV